jgi:hypothetical protein
MPTATYTCTAVGSLAKRSIYPRNSKIARKSATRGCMRSRTNARRSVRAVSVQMCRTSSKETISFVFTTSTGRGPSTPVEHTAQHSRGPTTRPTLAGSIGEVSECPAAARTPVRLQGDAPVHRDSSDRMSLVGSQTAYLPLTVKDQSLLVNSCGRGRAA